MQKEYQKALFIFRRDLRLEDNIGLLFALKKAKEVIACFIFTPEQIEDNPYFSQHCLQFMLDSLKDLAQALDAKNGKLYLFYGKPEEITKTCIQALSIDAVIVNRDYTPYSIKRDEKIELLCKKEKIKFFSFDDALLNPPEQTLKSDRKPYTIFTPFYRNASRLEVPLPVPNTHKNYYTQPIAFATADTLLTQLIPQRLPIQKGGRTEALKILSKAKDFASYDSFRDIPSLDSTTHLSAHLKFTTCSPREIYHAFKDNAELIRSLYWRDFFTSIAFYFPHVFKGAFRLPFNALPWSENTNHFDQWCQGKTGFPLIDAGMREMNQTGFMHNRVRMIVASFLIKDLHIDWRWGEKYFAQTLIDYDPAVNNGNWQWAASTGCDAQPYFRIFNPWIQALKFDPECTYIKKWIPELAALSPKTIHKWYLSKNHDLYLSPLVDHSIESKFSIESYKSIAKK